MGSCRCKMCGGHIHYEDNASVATCEFCGTEQTIVRSDDVKKVNLFNRANALRRENEFDKAQLTYDNILIDEPNNAEAHWGICLCRYGIEYVDTKDGKKVPTCHRTSVKSIFDDLDYKEAYNNADVVAKRVYEAEAKAIDKIQKEILSIYQKQDPYDIFISYKEYDNDNHRTKDSFKTETIYNELIKKGYRVFYSRVSLKNVDVSKYEPYIFSALMSSKVMLSVGSSKDNFNGTWTKNEWSRFIFMMQEDKKKYLIPCYYDMDRNDLPVDFNVFDSIDIKESLEELLSRLDKLFTTSEKVVVSTEQAVAREKAVNKISVENNIGRIGLFLADGDFAKVNSLSEKVLDTDYKNALAYYYKMLASYGCKNESELIKQKIRIDQDRNYEKALSFADDELKNKILDINNQINEAIIESEKQALIKKIDSLISNKKYSDAYNLLSDLDKYKDTLDIKLKYKENLYNIAKKKEEEKAHNDAISILSLLGDYKDSISLIGEINYIIRVEDECKKCDKLCASIEARIRHINDTKVYDDDALKKIEANLEEIKELTLCSYSMEKYEYLKNKYNELKGTREKIKFVSKIVVSVMVVVALIVVIYVFCFYKG